MENVPKTPQKSNTATCPDCTLAVDLGGPCWIRVSPTPERTQAWHLSCRDRHLAELSRAAFKASEQAQQFAAALQMLGRISVALTSAGDTISAEEAVQVIRDLVGETPAEGNEGEDIQ